MRRPRRLVGRWALLLLLAPALWPAQALAAPTATSLAVTPSPSVRGQAVDLTAAVTGDPGTTPTGTVQFATDGTSLGAPVAVSGGQAQLSTSALAVGIRSLTAAYTPALDTTFEASTSAPVLQTVALAPTTTTLAVAPDPSVAGQDVTFTATVTRAPQTTLTPAGAVQFTEDDGTPIGDPVTLQGNTATIEASIGAGAYTVRAQYLGNADFAGSQGSAHQTVNRAGTTVSISSDANPVAPNGAVTFTVLVRTTAPGGVVPSGTITILADGEDVSDGPVAIGAVTPTVAGVAVTFRAPGQADEFVIGAHYSGDAQTLPSDAPTFVQTVRGPASAPRPTVPPASTFTAPTAAPVTSTQAPPAATTSAALTAMTARLVDALKHKGLRALRTTTQTLTVSAPGRLSQRVYLPRAPASVTTARTRLIASGTRRFTAAGAGQLKLRLTRSGKQVVRQKRSRNLEIVTQFRPQTGPAVVTRQRVTVRPR